ncbi:tRNA (adenine(58)-N(1))-methyltransferase non-catalytic subunit trm6 [Cadophora gregata f. sp. sojae]|nr:tRNA (adenine(58)-N(1))-methyltransferase non-catalytic subunit trm6 [Cadophora gregata f. sp. sojae]
MVFKVSPATPSDIPGIIPIFFSSFTGPRAEELFPPTGSGKEWLADSIEAAIANPGLGCQWLVVTDEPESSGEAVAGGENGEKKGKVVANVMWVKHPGGEVPSWNVRMRAEPPEGVTSEALDGFFGPMARQHHKAMGERPHFFLESVSTDPAYRGRGLASLLLDWGVKAADEVGWECYLDGTAKAVPLYQRYGFVGLKEQDPECISLPMVRPAKSLV